jgi:hypothetical protein
LCPFRDQQRQASLRLHLLMNTSPGHPVRHTRSAGPTRRVEPQPPPASATGEASGDLVLTYHNSVPDIIYIIGGAVGGWCRAMDPQPSIRRFQGRRRSPLRPSTSRPAHGRSDPSDLEWIIGCIRTTGYLDLAHSVRTSWDRDPVASRWRVLLRTHHCRSITSR